MKSFYSILVCILVLILVSCRNEKDALIAGFEGLVKKASNAYANCDETTWSQIDDEFKKLDIEYSQIETNLSEKEKEKIDRLRGRFYSLKMKYEANRIKQRIKGVYNCAKGFADEFFNDQ